MKKSSADLQVLSSFLTWRLLLFLIGFFAVVFIPHFNLSFPYVNTDLAPTGLPSWVWGFGNFDGVHYIRIARLGYAANQYTQAFFPLYPSLIKVFSFASFYFLAGFLISNISFLAALYFLYRLFCLDYEGAVSKKALLLLLAFPTAYYFGAVYTESLFLLLSVVSILLIRKKMFLLSGLFIFLASLTRVIGVLLVFILLAELFGYVREGKLKLNTKTFLTGVIAAALGSLGLIAYMVYLKVNFNNPLYFLTAQPIFGAQRSDSLVLLPQVFYRYIKIFESVPLRSQAFFSAALEFVFSLFGLLILLFSVTKVRLSYWLFSAFAYLLPTLTGTFSSMPRYVLMEFLLLPLLVKWLGRFYLPVVVLLLIGETILLSLFLMGYWVA